MKSFPSDNLLPREGEAYLLTNFIDEISAQKLMSDIYDEVLWREDKITMFGKTYPQARKVAWHGDPKVTYTYSGIKMVAPGWSSRLKQLTDKIHTTLGCQFNSALVNYYRDGKDHMSWHQDNEPELGDNPVIASLSLGASRDFFLNTVMEINWDFLCTPVIYLSCKDKLKPAGNMLCPRGFGSKVLV